MDSNNSFLENARKLGKIINENQSIVIEQGKKIFDNLRYDEKDQLIYYIFYHIYKCHKENNGVSYRTIIYHCFEFDLSSYVIMQLAGMLELNNIMLDTYMKNYTINEKKYISGEKVMNRFCHDERLSLLAYIIDIFVKNDLEKFLEITRAQNDQLYIDIKVALDNEYK